MNTDKFCHTEITSNYGDMIQKVREDKIEISSVKKLNDGQYLISYKDKKEYRNENFTTSLCVGSFVTAYGRRKFVEENWFTFTLLRY